MKDYRFDVRTEDQFKKDLLANHAHEAEIAIRLCIYKKNLTGKWPELKPVSSEPTGEFIEKPSRKDSTSADYRIDNTNIEITKSGSMCKKVFHEKKAKVHRCIDVGYHLAFINGFNTPEPLFVVLKPKQIQTFTDMSKEKYGIVPFLGSNGAGAINKDAYRYNIEWFEKLWIKLPQLIKKIPSNYEDILYIARGNFNGKK